MTRNVRGKVRVAIDFRTPEAAIAFVDWLRVQDGYTNADAYAMDGLDLMASSGITNGNTYMLKNGQDRIPGSALRDLWDQKHWFAGLGHGSSPMVCEECGLGEKSPVHRKAK